MYILEKGTVKKDDHYVVPLLFQNENLVMSNNRIQALRRLECLKIRFLKDERFFKDYEKFMNDHLIKGYAKRAMSPLGKTWYIPDHGVYHPSKPGKVCVIFDCSVEFEGRYINQELLSGPDLTNQIGGVLTCFRQEPVAFMADVESMYYLVIIPDSQQSFLKNFWWNNSNLLEKPQHFVMCAQVFGGKSSASCSNYALRRTAVDNESIFGKDGSEALQKNFYVDNLLSKKLLLSIPDSQRRIGAKDQDLSGQLPNEKALGIFWEIGEDAFIFKIKLDERVLTKRVMLSVISSIYDPLGFAAPFVLEGRKILQSLCEQNVKWDVKVCNDVQQSWNKWKRKLKQIEQLHVQRYFKPADFGDVTSVSFHHFSDVSELGYGQCSYIRMVSKKGQIHWRLLLGKARVVPKKFVSITRLELTATTLSVKVVSLLTKELDLNAIEERF